MADSSITIDKIEAEPNRKSYLLKILLDGQEKLKMIKSTRIDFSEPILFWQGIPFLFKNSINIVQGQKGSHKSRLIECICSVLISDKNRPSSLIGINKNESHDITVVLIDTERNQKEQLPYALQQILLKGGYSITDDPLSFEYISLIDIHREERFKALEEFIKHIRKKYKTHIVIALDVMTDCAISFNNVEASLELIDMMNAMINQFDSTFLAVIHENPSTIKSRGHLGTESTNKATVVLQTCEEKDSDLIKVSFLHCRTIKRPLPIFLKYSDELKTLVLADTKSVTEFMDSRNTSVTIKEIIEKLKMYAGVEIEGKILIPELATLFNCSDRTIKERLKAIIQNKNEIIIEQSKYYLSIKKNGRGSIYYFTQGNSNEN